MADKEGKKEKSLDLREMIQEDREEREKQGIEIINEALQKLQEIDCVLDFIEVRRNGQFSGAQWKVTAN